jgi:hypothetical protein
LHPAAVADAGGLLVLAGLLAGVDHEVDEILVLDSTALMVAEYLSLRHRGAPFRARTEYGLVGRVVREWFPVRALALDAVLAAGDDGDVEAHAALALAESLEVPVVTKNRDLASRLVPVLVC